MIFTGHAELTIDAKQRLAIPSKYRSLLKPERDGTAWCCVPWQNKSLMLFTEARFNELAEKRGGTLTPGAEQQVAESDFFGLTERLEMDSAGRIALPRLHLQLTKLGTDVVMIGSGRRLEVRDRQAWMDGLEDRFANLPALVKKLEEQERPRA